MDWSIRWLLQQTNIYLSKWHKQSRGWKDKATIITINIYLRPQGAQGLRKVEVLHDFFKYSLTIIIDLQIQHVNTECLFLNFSLNTFNLIL